MELTNEQREEKLKALRAPFPPNQILLLPKPYDRNSPKGFCQECGGRHGLPAAHIPYVGHAALTARLLDVDPEWRYDPLAVDEDGLPKLDKDGGFWIKLTVLGVTRLGYGDATNQRDTNGMKEKIGDALRNAAMRFGVALELWHKGVLYAEHDLGDEIPAGQVREPAEQAPEPIEAPELQQIAVALAQAPDTASLQSIWKSFYVRATEEQRLGLESVKNRRKDELNVAAVTTAADLAAPGAPMQPMGTQPPTSRTRSPRLAVNNKPRNTTH